jgi:RNAse (barnase) inhibitor barstar
MKQYILDGYNIKDLDGFFGEFGRAVLGEGGYFGKDLDSFDDCLFGGFGLENPCTLIWKNSDFSKTYLGHQAVYSWCQNQLDAKKYADDDGLNYLISLQKEAEMLQGSTMFDLLVEKIRSVQIRSSNAIIINLILL